MTLTKVKRIKALALVYSTLQLLGWAAGLFPSFVGGYSHHIQPNEKSQRAIYIISPASAVNFSLTKPEEVIEVTEPEDEKVNTQKKRVSSWLSSQHFLLKSCQPSLGKVSHIAAAPFARFASFPFSKVLRI